VDSGELRCVTRTNDCFLSHILWFTCGWCPMAQVGCSNRSTGTSSTGLITQVLPGLQSPTCELQGPPSLAGGLLIAQLARAATRLLLWLKPQAALHTGSTGPAGWRAKLLKDCLLSTLSGIGALPAFVNLPGGGSAGAKLCK
jgi:hypothetical protein